MVRLVFYTRSFWDISAFSRQVYFSTIWMSEIAKEISHMGDKIDRFRCREKG
jgi:hypothetical protein